MTDYRLLRVALLGAGAVGSQVAALLLKHADELADRAGARLQLAGIAVRSLDAPRDTELPRELFTTDAASLIASSDIVIELIGGIEPAREHILSAIGSGADVVTANKALLATHGPEIFEAADRVGASVYYEAAAAGAIPIIRPLRDSLAGDRVRRIMASSTARRTTSSIAWTPRVPNSPTCSPTRSAWDTRSRPDRRRRGLRRRAEGRDPRKPRLPHRRAARGRAP